MSDVYISQLAVCNALSGDEYMLIAQRDTKTKDQYITKFTTPNQLTATLQSLVIPTGTIWSYAGVIDGVAQQPPPGWLLCDGTVLSVSVYSKLYKVIGDTYGMTDSPGIIFKLPDIRGRFILGYSNNISSIAPRHGNFTGSIVLGKQGGEYAHKLTDSEIPVHNHPITERKSTNSVLHYPDYDEVTPEQGNNLGWTEQQQKGGPNGPFSIPKFIEMGGISLLSTGGNFYHNNTPPYICINHIIKY